MAHFQYVPHVQSEFRKCNTFIFGMHIHSTGETNFGIAQRAHTAIIIRLQLGTI
jgi:hypothetical protein